jgi:hypothetical protein
MRTFDLHARAPNAQEMMDRNAVYYGNERGADPSRVSKDLFQTATGYIKEKKIIPKDLPFWASFDQGDGRVAIYYNNFEVCDFDFFLQGEVVEMTNWIVNTLGIHRYRWGDAPLRYMTLSIFARADQILMREFEYRHPCREKK